MYESNGIKVHFYLNVGLNAFNKKIYMWPEWYQTIIVYCISISTMFERLHLQAIHSPIMPFSWLRFMRLTSVSS